MQGARADTSSCANSTTTSVPLFSFPAPTIPELLQGNATHDVSPFRAVRDVRSCNAGRCRPSDRAYVQADHGGRSEVGEYTSARCRDRWTRLIGSSTSNPRSLSSVRSATSSARRTRASSVRSGRVWYVFLFKLLFFSPPATTPRTSMATVFLGRPISRVAGCLLRAGCPYALSSRAGR